MPATVSRGRGRRTISEINMVPFIDVMLVLLIIFMVTAPLIAPSMIDLPSVGRGSKPPDQVIQVLIGKDEGLDVRIDERTVRLPLDAIADAVAEGRTLATEQEFGGEKIAGDEEQAAEGEETPAEYTQYLDPKYAEQLISESMATSEEPAETPRKGPGSEPPETLAGSVAEP